MAFNMTLDQEEIEKAIDAHVRTLVPGLRPETLIGISLSATRGPAGFTAAIDLNPTAETAKKAPSTLVEAKASEAPVEAKPTPVKVRTSGTKPLNIAAKAAEAKAETITQTSDTQALPAEKVTETAMADVTQDEEAARAADAMDVNQPITAQEPEPEEDDDIIVPEDPQPTEEAPRQSLFANMNKPKN